MRKPRAIKVLSTISVAALVALTPVAAAQEVDDWDQYWCGDPAEQPEGTVLGGAAVCPEWHQDSDGQPVDRHVPTPDPEAHDHCDVDPCDEVLPEPEAEVQVVPEDSEPVAPQPTAEHVVVEQAPTAAPVAFQPTYTG